MRHFPAVIHRAAIPVPRPVIPGPRRVVRPRCVVHAHHGPHEGA
ncbi:MAG: hypothetical protein QOG25_2248, partial [Acetobacteraceae bacterium]|nr:hypothetical protein [Acetobacteraceae bacterium]